MDVINMSALSADWSFFCGPEDTQVWDGDDFGDCFELGALVIPAHLLFMLSSLLYLFPSPKVCTYSSGFMVLLYSKAIVSLALITCPIIDILLKQYYLNMTLYPVDYVTNVAKSVSWLIHLVHLCVRYRRGITNLRGPCFVIFCFLLTYCTLLIHVRTVIVNKTISINDHVEKYITYVIAALQTLYFSLLIPNPSATVDRTQIDERRHLLGTTNAGEYDRFINSDGGYGSISYMESLAHPLGTAADNSNCLSKLLFSWVSPLVQKGKIGHIKGVGDIYHLPETMRTSYVDTKFWLVLKDLQMKNREQIEEKPISLLKPLWKCFGLEYTFVGFLKLIGDLTGFIGPMLLNGLVQYVDNQETGVHGYYFAIGLCVSTFLTALINTHVLYISNNIGIKVRTAIMTMLYRKVLSLSKCNMFKFTPGEIVNYMSVDTDRIANICVSFHALWSLPVQIAICLFLLHGQVGISFLAGVLFAVSLIPINKILANCIGRLSTKMMESKDSRVKLMLEILGGIRVIKFYAWEKDLSTWIQQHRKAEVAALKASIKF